MNGTYGPFWITHLTHEQHMRTCGYWFTVQTHGCTAHTAFRTREALDAWLDLYGIRLERPLGEAPDYVRSESVYRERCYMDFDAFEAIEGIPILKMSNGTHTLGKITTDDDGIRTVHYCNPNVKQRAAYDWRIADELIDHGDYTPPTHYLGQVVGHMTQKQYDCELYGLPTAASE